MTAVVDFLKSVTQNKEILCFFNGVCQSPITQRIQVDSARGEIAIQSQAAMTLVMLYDDCQQQQVFNVAAAANVEIVLIYRNSVEHTLTVKQDAASYVKLFQVSLGVRTLKNTIRVDLQAGYARCQVLGVQFAQGQQTVMTALAVFHHAAHTQSEVTYKSIADEKAEVILAARIHVLSGASKTVSETNLNNLLLSNTATIDAQPELEIYADDVKCSHGATVGDLDEDSLFYLISRGIDMQQARSMLMQAFFQGLIDQLNPVIRSTVMDQLDSRFLRDDDSRG